MRKFYGLTVASLLMLCACSNDSKVAGGTEAESTIALQVQLADGSPAAFTRVRALPDDFLSDGIHTAEWVNADENGLVEIPMDPGKYTVEARHVNRNAAAGAVQKFTLDANTSKVDTVKLGDLSSIEGFILFGDSSSVVRVAGLERFVVPDSNGYFVIDSLPAGSFDVQFGDPLEERSVVASLTTGDTSYVDISDSVASVFRPEENISSEYPKGDWSAHESLVAEIEGYAVGTLGAAGKTDSLGNIEPAEGEICEVTTTEDFIIVEDTTSVDSTGAYTTTAVVAPGSLRECASKDNPVWIIFKQSGTYNLQSPLRLKSDLTIDGRGRDIRITGMGVLTNESSNIIFENLTFTAPAITVQDTSSRRALSIHNLTHHVWVDHCTFEEYPLVELDIKRSSHHVTVSWSRFENAQTGILFGLDPYLFDERDQIFTMHHNYFAKMGHSAAFARSGKIHAYNNFFMDLAHYGIECTDSASCYIEKNVFNIEGPVSVYRLFEDDGPVDSTLGFVNMVDNWYTLEVVEVAGDALGYKPEYKYKAEKANADLAWKVKVQSGPR